MEKLLERLIWRKYEKREKMEGASTEWTMPIYKKEVLTIEAPPVA